MKPLKGMIFVLALFLIAVRASAQAVVPGQAPMSQTEVQLLQWAVTQGGLVLVVLVVIWSYRRDFHRVFQSEMERNRQLISAIDSSTAALTMQAEVMRSSASADREKIKAFMELTASIKACEAVRLAFHGYKIENPEDRHRER